MVDRFTILKNGDCDIMRQIELRTYNRYMNETHKEVYKDTNLIAYVLNFLTDKTGLHIVNFDISVRDNQTILLVHHTKKPKENRPTYQVKEIISELTKFITSDKDFDHYTLNMVLATYNGIKTTESYKNISLHDFEVLYGNEIREIESVVLTKQKGFEK